MTGFYVFLVILGLLIVFSSYFISEKVENEEIRNYTSENVEMKEFWTKKDEDVVKSKIDKLISEKTEEAIIKVDDNLSQISNEKIMAVGEFSDQILEKLDQNHTEVIFLYNMLNEKEKELKDLMLNINKAKSKIEDGVVKETLKQDKVVSNVEDMENRESSNFAKEMDSNNNKQILKLFSEGKSVVEISKQLGLGQGEVKLVIGLFQGVKL